MNSRIGALCAFIVFFTININCNGRDPTPPKLLTTADTSTPPIATSATVVPTTHPVVTSPDQLIHGDVIRSVKIALGGNHWTGGGAIPVEKCENFRRFFQDLYTLAHSTVLTDIAVAAAGQRIGTAYGISPAVLLQEVQWDRALFHALMVIGPDYLSRCGVLTLGNTRLSKQCNEKSVTFCPNEYATSIRENFGEDAYPGINDPVVAARKTLELGLKWANQCNGSEAMEFGVYSDRVWAYWWQEDVYDSWKNHTPQSLGKLLDYVELSFPIGGYSWSDGVDPLLYWLGCTPKLSKVRRQAFLDLVNKRLQIGFWSEKVSQTYRPVPKTIDELCRR